LGTTWNNNGNAYSYPSEEVRSERGSRRVFRAAVRVWGMGPSGEAFFQQVHTVEVGLFGARIEGLTHEVAIGEVLGVEYRDSRARFKVIWAGQEGTPDAGKVELTSVDKFEDFWRLGPGTISQPGTPGERRSAARHACKGSSLIRQLETGFPLGAAVTDISLSGCYVELMTTLAVGTRVDMVLQVAGITVHCAATVQTSHPGVGMGMGFEPMSEADGASLEEVLARLAASS